MAGDDLTLGELGRRLTDMTGRLETVVVRFDTTYVRLDLFNQTIKDLEKRVGALEQRSEWLIRTVAGVIVTAILGIVFAYAKGSGKGG